MLFDELKELVVDELSVDANDVTMEARLTEDLGADSLDLFELIMAIEDKFGVKIPNEDLASIKTVKDAVDYIEQHR